MQNDYFAILINALVTLAGVFGGIITANKLTNYRIEQLEKRVEKHNNTIERTYKLEQGFEDFKSETTSNFEDLKDNISKIEGRIGK